MVKVEPTPRRDWSCTSPPWVWTVWRTMARPSPVPPSARARALSARQKRSNTCGWSSGAIPGPSSDTAIQARPRSLPTARRIRDPAGARRTAFSSRFATARFSASRSPITTTLGGSGGTVPRPEALRDDPTVAAGPLDESGSSGGTVPRPEALRDDPTVAAGPPDESGSSGGTVPRPEALRDDPTVAAGPPDG